MARKASYTVNNKENGSGGANLGFEQTLWAAADKMRGHVDPSEYKHVVLGLIFLKYISDAFDEKHNELTLLVQDPRSDLYIAEESDRYQVTEDRDEYRAENVFWVPETARWSYIQSNAKQPTIGKIIDDAMEAIEKENPALKGVLSKDYARPTLDKHRLGELVDLVSKIGLGDRESRSKDVLGRVYEYFLGQFAGQEGRGGGEHYTPRCVVRLLVEMIEPFKGRVYDPCCGSAGMFVQSEEFIKEHGGRINDISIFGQESNPTTWRLARMNLAIRGIEANLGPHNGDTFHNDLHRDLKADFILANPQFNASDWGGDRLRADVRWKYGVPPVGNANFAWVEHIIHHLAPNGVAGFVLANGSLSSNTSGEGDIRKNIVEADLVDCIIALPGQLFYGTGIPACLWFLSRNKAEGKFRTRKGETLFIDCRKMGNLIDRTHRELNTAVRQIVSKSVTSNEVIDIFGAAGLDKPEISILSDEFLAEVQGLEYKNLALEALRKLLADQIKAYSRTNLVQSRQFSQMLEESIRRLQNRSLETAQVIAELVALAKEMREANRRGEKLGLTEDELAFYDALEVNDSAVKILGDDTLRDIARELVKSVRGSVTIDWNVKESARARLRVLVKRILRRYGYPPDKQEQATQTLLEQTELLCTKWI